MDERHNAFDPLFQTQSCSNWRLIPVRHSTANVCVVTAYGVRLRHFRDQSFATLIAHLQLNIADAAGLQSVICANFTLHPETHPNQVRVHLESYAYGSSFYINRLRGQRCHGRRYYQPQATASAALSGVSAICSKGPRVRNLLAAPRIISDGTGRNTAVASTWYRVGMTLAHGAVISTTGAWACPDTGRYTAIEATAAPPASRSVCCGIERYPSAGLPWRCKLSTRRRSNQRLHHMVGRSQRGGVTRLLSQSRPGRRHRKSD